jgi:hypothetical protein
MRRLEARATGAHAESRMSFVPKKTCRAQPTPRRGRNNKAQGNALGTRIETKRKP